MLWLNLQVKTTSEGRSSVLIDLLTVFDIFSNRMFFSFVNFITNRGFFLTYLEKNGL